MTEKTYGKLFKIGFVLLIPYFIGSFYIQDYNYIRLGLALNLFLITLLMLLQKMNKIAIFGVVLFFTVHIIFYMNIRAFLIST